MATLATSAYLQWESVVVASEATSCLMILLYSIQNRFYTINWPNICACFSPSLSRILIFCVKPCYMRLRTSDISYWLRVTFWSMHDTTHHSHVVMQVSSQVFRRFGLQWWIYVETHHIVYFAPYSSLCHGESTELRHWQSLQPLKFRLCSWAKQL